MYKRIISALLIFALLISSVEINSYAMPLESKWDYNINSDIMTGFKSATADEYDTKESAKEDYSPESGERVGEGQSSNAEEGTEEDSNPEAEKGTVEEQRPDTEEGTGKGQSSNAEGETEEDSNPEAEKGTVGEQRPDTEEGTKEDQNPDAEEGTGEDQSSNTEEGTGEDQSSNTEEGTGEDQSSNIEEGNEEENEEGQSSDGEETDNAQNSDIMEESDKTFDAETPSESTSQSFLIDMQEPYDGDCLLVANVNIQETGENETAGSFTSADIASSDKSFINSSGIAAVSESGSDIYDYDEYGRGLIDPASFLPEAVLDENGVSYLSDEEAAPTEYEVGEERIFYLNNQSNNTYNEVNCVCVAISEYATVWVPADDDIYVEDADKMKAYMSELAQEFDVQFPKMTEMFGSKDTVEAKYGDNDGKTALLCYDINGNGMSGSSYTAGYFFSADLNINYKNSTNNKIDCLHIDSWQGMSRNTSSNTLNPTQSKRTMVHELQHMINFSVCRDNEESFLQLKIPTWLNEAYSEAAAHLCYGEASNRISNYNSYSDIPAGKVSLIKWNSNYTLPNYALSYLFSQYIRIQYENGSTIYKDTMNDLNESTDLLTVIADKLGISAQELLFNFRAALFLKNAEGKYGFGGEEWAESINSKSVSASSVGSSLSLAPGAAAVIDLRDSFEPSQTGEHIRYAGMYKEVTDDDVAVSISGGDSITADMEELQLTASVYPKGVSQEVIFSLPYPEDEQYAKVTADGLVIPISEGSITVRATSVFDPSRYADKVIAVSARGNVIFEQNISPVFGGVSVNYEVVIPKRAVLYYTIDSDVPNVESGKLPEEGLLFDKEGTYSLKIFGHDDEGVYKDVYDEAEIVIGKSAAPVISEEDMKMDKTDVKLVTILSPEDAEVYYTLDGTAPSPEQGIKYEEPFIISEEGATTVKAVVLQKGKEVSEAAEKNIDVDYVYETMEESEHKPYMTQVSFSINKKATEPVTFSVRPILENRIAEVKFVQQEDDFIIERVSGTDSFNISLANKEILNKTYTRKLRIVSKGSGNARYADLVDIKIKVVDAEPKVSLKAITVNTVYPNAGYPISVTSGSGSVEILGIEDAGDYGFTQNFYIKDGALYLKRKYEDFVRTASGKPVLSGKLNVRVQGYEESKVNIKIKISDKPPVLSASKSQIRLNYNKLDQDKYFEFTLDNKITSKKKETVEDIKEIRLDDGKTSYKKAAELIKNVSCADGRNIKVEFKDSIKPGTYTMPLLVSAQDGENAFSDVCCSVKFTIDKENAGAVLKPAVSKVSLNKRMSGEKAYISIKNISQYNMELTDIECKPASSTGSVNPDDNVSLVYNAEKGMLEAKIKDGKEPAGKTYKFICTPVYVSGALAADPAAEDAEYKDSKNSAAITVKITDKAASVSLKAKGNIDVLNRDSSAVTYTVRKVNFVDEIRSVRFKRASKISQSVLDAAEYFNEPVLNDDSTVTITAKEEAVFTKGMKYAFKLEFTLKNAHSAEAAPTVLETKDITIKPKQSKVRLSASAKPAFYRYVNSGNNYTDLRLTGNNGIIEKVEYDKENNRKIPEGITPVIEDGLLTGITFDGSAYIKKGRYKLVFKVYYKGQLWEKATKRSASYAKPVTYKLTVTVK